MTPQEKASILNALPANKSAVLTLARSPEPSAIDDQMSLFCEQLVAITPHIKIKKESDGTLTSPALITGARSNIAYQAIPAGKMLQRFVEALAQTADSRPPMDGDLEKRLAEVELPVALKLYVAEQCPHCPKALERFQSLAGASSKIRLAVIDAAMFQQLSQADNVRSVPTLILDDQFRWTGQIDVKEVLNICIERDPAELSADSLRQMIEDGAAQAVSQMMMDSGRHFPALIELLAHERWSVRLGAMVVAEYLAEAAPALADEMIEPLWQGINGASQQAQGDMVHVLGQIPSPVVHTYLHRVITGAFQPSVVEAAREALEALDEA